MIFTERKITVRKGKSSIDEPVILYRGDFEVELRFTIMETKYRFKSGVNLVDSEKASYAQLALLAPDGANVFTEVGRCEDGTAIFVLSKEMIDELSEVGLYSFQIRLFDYYRESRITIPPIEFGIEVREPIAAEDHINAVDQAMVGYSIAKTSVLDEPVSETFDANGQYNKTNWETGDRISEGKLNKIEDAIDVLNQNKDALNKQMTSNFNVLTSQLEHKANNSDVVKKGYGTLNDFDEQTRAVLQGLEAGNINAVLGVENVTNENIKFSTIDRDKTVFYDIESLNKMTHTTRIEGGFYSASSGSFVDSIYFYSTEYIQVVSNQLYYTNATAVVFYNSNYDIIGGSDVVNGEIITLRNCNFVRCNFSNNITSPYLNCHRPSSDNAVIDRDLRLVESNFNDIQFKRQYLSFYKNAEQKELVYKDGFYYSFGGENYVQDEDYFTFENFITVDPSTTYTTNAFSVIEFDEDYNPVKGYDIVDNEFMTSSSTKYIKINFPIDRKEDYFLDPFGSLDGYCYDDGLKIFTENLSDSVIQFIAENIQKDTVSKLKGLKWAVLGDSITQSSWGNITKYDELISNKTGIINYNYGIGGSSISVRSGRSDHMCVRYTSMIDDADIITVFGGINDYDNNLPIGSFTDNTEDSFFGALHILCNGLLEKYPEKKIGFITPLQRRGYNRELLSGYVNAIKEVCSYYSIPVLNLFENGLMPDIDAVNTSLFLDGLHPNNNGHEFIMNKIMTFLESL